MSRLWHGGAEWQSDLELPSVYGATIDTTIKYGNGAASWEFSGSVAADDVAGMDLPALGNQTTLYFKENLYIDNLPDAPEFVYYFDFMTSGSVSVVSVNIWNDAGTLWAIAYYNNFGSNSGAVPLGVAMDGWFRIEAKFDSTPADGSETFEIRINGVSLFATTNLTYTNKNVAIVDMGLYNGLLVPEATAVVYADNIILQNAAGSVNNSWVGDENIVLLKPAGAGSSAPQAGDHNSVNEIPATNTASSSANRIELDNNGSAAYFTLTNPSSLIGASDTIKAILGLGAVREESAATTSYQLALKSASGGTPATTTAADAGNATVRVNPNGTTAFGRLFISETDPTTGVAWTRDGTNSLSNAQFGALSASANDIWFTALGIMVGYTPASTDTSKMLQMF